MSPQCGFDVGAPKNYLVAVCEAKASCEFLWHLETLAPWHGVRGHQQLLLDSRTQRGCWAATKREGFGEFGRRNAGLRSRDHFGLVRLSVAQLEHAGALFKAGGLGRGLATRGALRPRRGSPAGGAAQAGS